MSTSHAAASPRFIAGRSARRKIRRPNALVLEKAQHRERAGVAGPLGPVAVGVAHRHVGQRAILQQRAVDRSQNARAPVDLEDDDEKIFDDGLGLGPHGHVLHDARHDPRLFEDPQQFHEPHELDHLEDFERFRDWNPLVGDDR